MYLFSVKSAHSSTNSPKTRSLARLYDRVIYSSVLPNILRQVVIISIINRFQISFFSPFYLCLLLLQITAAICCRSHLLFKYTVLNTDAIIATIIAFTLDKLHCVSSIYVFVFSPPCANVLCIWAKKTPLFIFMKVNMQNPQHALFCLFGRSLQSTPLQHQLCTFCTSDINFAHLFISNPLINQSLNIQRGLRD